MIEWLNHSSLMLVIVIKFEDNNLVFDAIVLSASLETVTLFLTHLEKECGLLVLTSDILNGLLLRVCVSKLFLLRYDTIRCRNMRIVSFLHYDNIVPKKFAR